MAIGCIILKVVTIASKYCRLKTNICMNYELNMTNIRQLAL